jgi:PAT family beta-lactamase induction signal transducer AmpG
MNLRTLRLWIVHFLLGLSAGLPYLLTGSTLQAWMTDQHIDLKVIGLFALVRAPYNFKFVWAPIMDRFSLPFLTRRRAWMVTTQIGLAASLFALSFSNPSANPYQIAALAVLVAFVSASQDIVIDAYRTESLHDRELGMATSNYITGYRVGMLISGALALFIVDQFKISWGGVYQIMAGVLAVGVFASFLAPESKATQQIAPKTMKEAVVEPFLDFFTRKNAILLIVFMIIYKFGDNLAGAMTTPFILQSGYTKTEYAAIAKGVGFIAVLAGGFLGGPVMLRLGIIRSLWVFGFGQMLSVLTLVWLASIPKNLTMLGVSIGAENFAIGLGSAAFTAFVSTVVNRKYSATQYALLTSLMALSSTILSAPSGWLAEKLGWVAYFAFCAAMAIPGLVLLVAVGASQKKLADANPQ